MMVAPKIRQPSSAKAERPATVSAPAAATGWGSARERGSAIALRLLTTFMRVAGNERTRILLPPIAAYYCVFAREGGRASRQYQERIRRRSKSEDRAVGMRDVYRHFLSFAEVILDRLAFWSNDFGRFEFRFHGLPLLQRHFDRGRGAVLVGAHLGSFDALRAIARQYDIPVSVMMYTGNAEIINDAIARMDPGSNMHVIAFDPSSVRAAFELRRRVARGELVAIMGDRLFHEGRERVAYAGFLGSRAAFPQGPFLLALVLRIPLVLSLAFKSGPNTYDIHFETLHDEAPVPARDRERVLQGVVEKYAARLEHHCLDHPLQWFNFFDFWREAPE